MNYLSEAFQKLEDILDEDVFDLDKDGLEDLRDFQDESEEETIDVYDPDAETEEDLEDSYIGKVILDCSVCHTDIYKDKEDVIIDEETQLANVGEECPYCFSIDGFKVIGEVKPFVETEFETEDDVEVEVDGEEVEEEEEEDEEKNESLKRKKRMVEAVSKRKLKESSLGKGEDGRYTVDQLLDVIGSYAGMIERDRKENNGEYGIVVLDDILSSAKFVLKQNNYSGRYKNLVEAPVYGLEPRYDSRKSFYGKAQVDTGDKGDKNKLYSYGTLVAEIKDGKPVVYGTYSQTTLRHIKDWLKQNGFRADTSKQIVADYGVKDESFGKKKSNRILEKRHKNFIDFNRNLYSALQKNNIAKDWVGGLGNWYAKDFRDALSKVDALNKLGFKADYEKTVNGDAADSFYYPDYEFYVYVTGEMTDDEKKSQKDKITRQLYDQTAYEYNKRKMKESLTESSDFYDVIGNYDEELVGDEVNGFVFKDQKSAAKFTKYLDRESIDYYIDNTSDDDKRYYGKDYLYKVVAYDDELSDEDMQYAESLKESVGQDVSEYQKWVDYDMKKYKKISKETMSKIKKAGLSVVKDQYGDYEVIADRKDESCGKRKSRKRVAESKMLSKTRILKESMSDSELAREIEKAVEWLKESQEGCSTIKLDGRLAVCVGWLSGYSESTSDGYVHAEDDPSWCVNAGIKVWTSDSMRTDYEYINAPYDEDTGDVWDTDVTISENENYSKLAKYFMKEYEAMSEYDIDKDGAIVGKWSDEDEEFEESCGNRKPRKIKESIEDITIDTGDQEISVSARDKEEVKSDGEMIAPLSDEVKTDIEMNTDEEENGEEVDVDMDEFSEEDFDGLGESYLKKVYENVDSYKTTSVSENGNKIVVEGLIKFNSGKTKKTSFVFEAKTIDKNGHAKFLGENLQISRGHKSFKLAGTVVGNKFISESLNYNYRAKDGNGKSVRVYGTIRNKK